MVFLKSIMVLTILVIPYASSTAEVTARDLMRCRSYSYDQFYLAGPRCDTKGEHKAKFCDNYCQQCIQMFNEQEYGEKLGPHYGVCKVKMWHNMDDTHCQCRSIYKCKNE